MRSGFHHEKLAKSYTNIYKSNISENAHLPEFHLNILLSLKNDKKVRYLRKDTFLHNTPLNKKILEWAIYPIETVKIRFGSSLNFTSKNWLSPMKK